MNEFRTILEKNNPNNTEGIINMVCPHCKFEDHEWEQVYSGTNSKLVKIEKAFISWCKQHDGYVLITL